MKKLTLTILSLLILFCTYAQSKDETEIRKLENDAKEAFLKKDTITLLKLYSPSVVINSPANRVQTLPEVFAMIRGGATDRDTYEKVIERITFAENIAIVMGNETVKPTGTARNAGKTVKRRYTNVWMKREKSWVLVARQSTVFSVE